jgi:hypothetical protein
VRRAESLQAIIPGPSVSDLPPCRAAAHWKATANDAETEPMRLAGVGRFRHAVKTVRSGDSTLRQYVCSSAADACVING